MKADLIVEEDVDNFYISWSDLMALLLVFFIYLYSISEIDVVKFLETKEAMQGGLVTDTEKNLLEILKLEQQKLQQMQVDITQFITDENLQDVFSVEFLDDRLELNMGNALLFSVGESSLKPKAKSILGKLGVMFDKSDSKIIVEGHTDNIPIKTKEYPSNWELSSSRASSVVRFLTSKGVAGSKFVVIGYNQYVPLVPNVNEASRAKNRRVKITLKPDTEKLIEQARKGSKTNG